jgi:NTP pyrophosphatase (non-canonical NTP hydrolase)
METSKIIDIDHKDMVSKLMKNPTEIMKTLDGDQGLKKIDLLHGSTGLSGEVGELVDAIKKHVFYNKPIDFDNAIEELGDIEFYLEAIRQNLGITREHTLKANIGKLAVRYSNFEYSDEKAKLRADKN